MAVQPPNLPLLATPALWYPGQDEGEWEFELEQTIARSRVTDAFLNGEVDPDWFLDYLAQDDLDPLEVAEEEWELWQ